MISQQIISSSSIQYNLKVKLSDLFRHPGVKYNTSENETNIFLIERSLLKSFDICAIIFAMIRRCNKYLSKNWNANTKQADHPLTYTSSLNIS